LDSDRVLAENFHGEAFVLRPDSFAEQRHRLPADAAAPPVSFDEELSEINLFLIFSV
jgi:hypothetical protein